jgi:hypothetical protein
VEEENRERFERGRRLACWNERDVENFFKLQRELFGLREMSIAYASIYRRLEG